MIIQNEKDLFILWRRLSTERMPFEVDVSHRFTDMMAEFEEQFKDELGEHPGGYKDDEEHW